MVEKKLVVAQKLSCIPPKNWLPNFWLPTWTIKRFQSPIVAIEFFQLLTMVIESCGNRIWFQSPILWWPKLFSIAMHKRGECIEKLPCVNPYRRDGYFKTNADVTFDANWLCHIHFDNPAYFEYNLWKTLLILAWWKLKIAQFWKTIFVITFFDHCSVFSSWIWRRIWSRKRSRNGKHKSNGDQKLAKTIVSNYISIEWRSEIK